MKRVACLWILMLMSVNIISCASVSTVGSDGQQSVVSKAWIAIEDGAFLIDVRSESEFAAGAIGGAVNIPHDQIINRANELGVDKERRIVVYCRSGRRAGIAESSLRKLGFKNVLNAGGYSDLLRSKSTT